MDSIYHNLKVIEDCLQHYADKFKNARGSQLAANQGLAALDKVRSTITKAEEIANTPPTPTTYVTHKYEPHKKYPWFCRKCGYAEHEVLNHGETP